MAFLLSECSKVAPGSRGALDVGGCIGSSPDPASLPFRLLPFDALGAVTSV